MLPDPGQQQDELSSRAPVSNPSDREPASADSDPSEDIRLHCEHDDGEQKSSPAEIPSAENVVEQLQHELAQRLGPRSYNRCFKAGAKLAVSGTVVTVSAVSPFLLRWVQRDFRAVIVQTVRDILGPAGETRFTLASASAANVVSTEPKETAQPKPTPLAVAAPEATATDDRDNSETDADPATQRVRRFASLSDFISCPANMLAFTAAREVCERPGTACNPVIFYGGVGVGKTHLLEGIAREFKRTRPRARTLFLTSEAFTNYFTTALRNRSTPGFRQRFRGVDLLLLDDFDFFDGKKGIAEELLHTFQQLTSQGKQIVLTADRHPHLLTKLSDELVSRCVAGLLCKMDTPDASAREKILSRQAQQLNLKITPPTLEWIANRFQNVREGQGAINILATHGRMNPGQTCSLAFARTALADLERDCTQVVSLADIEAAVAKFFNLTGADLRSAGRKRSLTGPRMLAMFLARKHTQAAYSEIGDFFGGRNHSTVISAEKRVVGWLDQSENLPVAHESWSVGQILDTLEKQLRAG
ncbi:DnaA ATPase domain-containing protein [Thalassoroseus pseudoceratinae]|uniref:DnaA ATPase domain-containing protein n=1 Tax=Thalassoroseus pseudoceratinae TaxID=2713176 RepID=UPI0014207E59|nr:DnaA/Hda family protein [Thalassoroseus pseudoceratinae]